MVIERDTKGKQSVCYGCDAVLHNPSMLVCSDCLDDECDKFAELVETDLLKIDEE